MDSIKQIKTPEELEKIRQQIKNEFGNKKSTVSICISTGCVALGATSVLETFKTKIEKANLTDEVKIKETGCVGFCEQGPRVTIYPDEVSYFKVKPKDVEEIISQTIKENKIVERILYTDPITKEKARRLNDVPFYKDQLRPLLENNARIDPKDIRDYIQLDGYKALVKAISQMTPHQVIEEIKKSKLRGRGGGGFPTGIKWETTRNAPDNTKYVIVNCDEGDPGAFMDRSLMEGNPHSVLEGLIIGAFAIGAKEGFVYVREEYPLATENIKTAIEQANQYGFLGNDILGSGFDFNVKVHKGAGAFVSGESSALMTAIEGKTGEPRPKYVRTAVKGLWNKPTCLNNVKTWANVPLIIINGAEWFKGYRY